MAQEYVPISVTEGAFDELKKRKFIRQAELGRDLTWDEFLLTATKNNSN